MKYIIDPNLITFYHSGRVPQKKINIKSAKLIEDQRSQ